MENFLVKARRFLRSAQALYDLGDYDSCASRCYYAMWLMATAALAAKGISASSHRGVLRLFGEHLVKTGLLSRDLAKALSEAYDYRLLADYAVGTAITPADAQRLLQLAEHFIEQVSRYLSSSDQG